ncbi:Copper homeostasis protein CutC [Posidoniimonas polymericola]|uniref:PF03932 family protein CutC n=1 Tax=Posidoniimonas polymericola TaxID=2528002 RepID=A0A5C5ZGH9_9BACT|nr:copper homeostasis protein CutC [Posidoniimonas polymericola]TWT85981.1 Copper homeostasis protein CutC [Posidoniimonas polymericola]
MSHQNPLLEVCIGSLPDALAAEQAGANRLELCGALELGGLTPSLGLVEQVVEGTKLPVLAMLRPRAGGFAYREDELAVMLRDARHLVVAGASGVVFGVLTADSRIDREATARLVDAADGKEAVVHRAFDFVTDPAAALDELIELGVTRVLTTGGPATALEGAHALASLIEQAAGRIEILPGGGVHAAGVGELVRRTGCAQVHIGAAQSWLDPSLTGAQAASLCDLKRLAAGELRAVDSQAVAAVRAALDQPPV